ncbi:MAG: methyltransferase [Candidatus Dadabacteria bacterium]
MITQKKEEQTTVAITLNPSKIMQVGLGFWSSKVLLTATKLELFTQLAPLPLSAKQIKEKLKLHCSDRHVYDFLDALVSLGFLERKGLLENARYSNAEDTDLFLDKKKRTYMGGILEMANSRLYQFWNFLEDGLRTGEQQNEAKAGGNMEFFSDLYKDEHALNEFVSAMSGIQAGNFMAFATKFDFSNYKTLLDVGGADASLSISVCLRQPHIKCINFDLAPVEAVAKKKIASYNLANRIQTISGDFLKNELPHADLVTLGNILHGLDEHLKQQLIDKVYNSLPADGALVAIENIIDNDRRQNTIGLLMSLNMLIENGDGFDYTLDDFEKWAKKAGFKRVEQLPLTGPTSAAIAYK